MFRKMLRLAFGDGNSSIAGLSRAMETTPELTRRMFEVLERLGYIVLAPTQSGESSACNGCAQQTLCAPQDCRRVWRLTPSGQRILDDTRGDGRQESIHPSDSP
jgi:hypothetical protein